MTSLNIQTKVTESISQKITIFKFGVGLIELILVK